MRITWFGGSAFRLYVGGSIVVTDPDAAPVSVDRAELVAAADHTLAASGIGLPLLDAAWRPQRRRREIDEPAIQQGLRVFSLDGGGLLLDAPEDGPLIVASATAVWDRFADNVVAVLHGPADGLPNAVQRLCTAARPRLIALAAAPSERDFAAIAATDHDMPLQVLELGLALEA
jgi:hypothetical protein